MCPREGPLDPDGLRPDPARERLRSLEPTVAGELLELPAELGEDGGAEGGAVRLEGVRGPPQLRGVLGLDRVLHLREKAGGLRQERIDHLAEKGGTAHRHQVVERLTVELGDSSSPGGLRGAVLDGTQRLCQRPASTSSRIGFAR